MRWGTLMLTCYEPIGVSNVERLCRICGGAPLRSALVAHRVRIVEVVALLVFRDSCYLRIVPYYIVDIRTILLRSFGKLATCRSLCNTSALTGLGEKNRPGQRSVQDLGALRRRGMQQGDPILPGNSGSRTDSGPTGGGRRTRQRGLGVGKERTRGIPFTGGGREGAGRGGGRLGGGGIIDYLFFLFFLFITYVNHRKAEEGGEEATS